MNNQYGDMYRSQVQQQVFQQQKTRSNPCPPPVRNTTTTGNVATCTMVDPHLEAFLESLQQKTYTNDDKITNLTKLLKLTQSLQDERDSDIRKELEESRHRNRKLEQMNARLSAEMEELRGAVSRVNEDHRGVVESLRTSLLDVQREELVSLNHKVTRYSRDLVEFQSSVEERFREVHSDTAQHMQHTQSEIATKLAAHSDGVFLKMTSLQREVQASLESVGYKSAQVASEMDTTVRGLRQQFESFTISQCTIVEDNAMARIAALQEQIQSVHLSMSEYVHNYKEHVAQNTQKTNEIYDALKQLLEVHETTRSVLTGDLESMKEWMTKTTQRLKTKLEILATEVRTVREEHIKLMSDMLKNKGVAGKDAILEILSVKSAEATAMVSKMDDELQRTGRDSLRRTKSSSAAISPAVGAPLQRVGSHVPQPTTSFSTEAFLEKSKARRQQLDEMCTDLATLDTSLSKSGKGGV